MTQVDSLSTIEKAKLTTWIVDQRQAGEVAPFVTTDTVKRIKAARPLRIGARQDRFLLSLARTEDLSPGWRFGISGTDGAYAEKYKNLLMSWTECSGDHDLLRLTGMVAQDGYISDDGLAKIFITSKGFQRLEALEGTNASSRQGFIAMWFDPTMSDAAAAIGEAIRDAGYDPLIISSKEHNGDINDAIIGEIRRSRFIVADFTCGTLQDPTGNDQGMPRGGVYFEAGFAKGLGIEVIWCCREDQMKFVHFDTNHISHIVWKDPADLRARLARRIGATIGFSAEARV